MKDDLKDLDKLSDELICRVEVVLESAEPGRDRDAFESRFEDMKTRWNTHAWHVFIGHPLRMNGMHTEAV